MRVSLLGGSLLGALYLLRVDIEEGAGTWVIVHCARLDIPWNMAMFANAATNFALCENRNLPSWSLSFGGLSFSGVSL